MTKSQLVIRLSSKKLDRRVSPVRGYPRTYRYSYRESPRKTFVRANQYVNYVLNNAVNDAAEGSPYNWTSTHLVTLEVQVLDSGASHSSVIQQTLNGSQLCLLYRYLDRFAADVARGQQKRAGRWLEFNYQFYPLRNDRMAKAISFAFGDYE